MSAAVPVAVRSAAKPSDVLLEAFQGKVVSLYADVQPRRGGAASAPDPSKLDDLLQVSAAWLTAIVKLDSSSISKDQLASIIVQGTNLSLGSIFGQTDKSVTLKAAYCDFLVGCSTAMATVLSDNAGKRGTVAAKAIQQAQEFVNAILQPSSLDIQSFPARPPAFNGAYDAFRARSRGATLGDLQALTLAPVTEPGLRIRNTPEKRQSMRSDFGPRQVMRRVLPSGVRASDDSRIIPLPSVGSVVREVEVELPKLNLIASSVAGVASEASLQELSPEDIITAMGPTYESAVIAVTEAISPAQVTRRPAAKDNVLPVPPAVKSSSVLASTDSVQTVVDLGSAAPEQKVVVYIENPMQNKAPPAVEEILTLPQVVGALVAVKAEKKKADEKKKKGRSACAIPLAAYLICGALAVLVIAGLSAVGVVVVANNHSFPPTRTFSPTGSGSQSATFVPTALSFTSTGFPVLTSPTGSPWWSPSNAPVLATGSFTTTVAASVVPSPAASQANTLSLTQTSSQTQSPGLTPTPSPTQNPSATSTPSQALSSSLSGSSSPTASQGVTLSPTQSRSLTSTASLTQSPSATSTPSQALTSSLSGSSSPTQSRSLTQTSSQTQSPGLTPTPSPTQNPSATSTPSQALSSSLSGSSSPTASQGVTLSPTQSRSLTSTASLTQSPSATSTPSQVRTPSVSQTVSQSLTPSLTQSVTRSQIQTASQSQTKSQSQTGSVTQTRSLTQTASQIQTPSSTATPSRSQAPSPFGPPQLVGGFIGPIDNGATAPLTLNVQANTNASALITSCTVRSLNSTTVLRASSVGPNYSPATLAQLLYTFTPPSPTTIGQWVGTTALIYRASTATRGYAFFNVSCEFQDGYPPSFAVVTYGLNGASAPLSARSSSGTTVSVWWGRSTVPALVLDSAPNHV